MPLGNTPWRPRPEVELCEKFDISTKEAAKQLRSFVETSSRVTATEAATAAYAEIKIQQLPKVLERLEQDWLPEGTDAKCFIEVHARLEVHLHPYFMGPNLPRGLRRVAGELLLAYNPVLHCIPLTISDVTPAGSRHGAIVAESPYVHFMVNFRSVGFAPKEGQELVARVGEIQNSSSFNLQVLGMTHAFAVAGMLPKGLSYKKETWCEEKHGPLTEQDVIRFKVHQVLRGSSLSLSAALGDHLQVMTKGASSSTTSSSAARSHEVKEKKRKRDATQDDHNGVAAPQENGAESVTPSKGKKKKKKLES